MAIRAHNDPKNQFPRNIMRKNFGEASNKQGFIGNALQGAVTPYAWPMYWDRDGSATIMVFLASMAGMAFGSYELAHYQDTSLDFNPTHEVGAETHNSGVSTVAYNYDGTQYVLRQTEEGTQLFAQYNLDDSVNDDIYVLMDADSAEEVIREIGGLYHDLSEYVAGETDFWTDYNSAVLEQPNVIAYDGFSSVIDDPESNDFYLIADNYIGQEDTSILEAPQIYPAWETAMTQTTNGDYIQAPRNTVNGMALQDMNTDGFLTFLTVMGTLSGLGVAGGAAYSVNSSRRRFNKELGLG